MSEQTERPESEESSDENGEGDIDSGALPSSFDEFRRLHGGDGAAGRGRTVLIAGGVVILLGLGLVATETGRSVADTVADTVHALVYGPPPDYTNEGIFEAIATSKWEPVDEPSFIETDGERRVLRSYRWKDAEMRVDIRSLESDDAAAEIAREIDPPRVAMQFDTKVVVLSANRDDEALRLNEARRVLRHYRRMMKEQ